MNYISVMFTTALLLLALGVFLAGLSLAITAVCKWWDSHHR